MAMTAWAGEVLDQLDLLVGERPHLLAINGERTDELVVLEHRHNNQCTHPGDIGGGNRQWMASEIGAVFSEVGNLNLLAG